jgi:AGZA family xanthine/uracil permease-like MFS transporter
VLTFFGFMHGESIGFGESPIMALSYLVVSGVLLGCAKFAKLAPQPAKLEEHGGHAVPA